MSKLLDSLQQAARTRGEAARGESPAGTAPGLLQQALHRANAEKAMAIPPSPSPRGEGRGEGQSPRPDSWKPAVALIALLAGIVAFSWHITRQEERLAKRLPAVMKLDYQLDLSRTGGASRSSPPDPAPSK